MSFGFGLCLPSLNYVASLFSPLSLFANGEQGAWYDPSDLTTLFQDSAGTTPVTAVEQPVGLMLDKSKGLVLGSELVTNGDFSNGTTGWTASGATLSVVSGAMRVTNISASFGSAQQIAATEIGKTYRLTFTVGSQTQTSSAWIGSSSGGTQYRDFDSISSGSYTLTFTATSTTLSLRFLNRQTTTGNFSDFDNISVKELPGNHAFQSTSASRPVLSARVNLLTATNVLSTQSVTTVATTYKLFFAGTGAITLTGTATGVYTAGTYTVTCTAGTLIATVAGLVTQADLRVSNDGVGLPAYQRVNTSTDYDTAGFPLYLKTDGVDDWMRTNSINFTSTDKMTVWAGVRKLSDAGFGGIVELSAEVAVNNGSFLIRGPDSGANYFVGSKGTGVVYRTLTTYTAPITNTITMAANISAPLLQARVNGATVDTSTASQGAGNYGNYPLYLFRRGGTSLPFNGRMYGLIVRGAQSTASQIASGEAYMNQKSKAY